MTDFRGIILLLYIIIQGVYKKCLFCESDCHSAVLSPRCRCYLSANATEAVSWKPTEQMFLTDIALGRHFRNTALFAPLSLCSPWVSGSCLPAGRCDNSFYFANVCAHCWTEGFACSKYQELNCCWPLMLYNLLWTLFEKNRSDSVPRNARWQRCCWGLVQCGELTSIKTSWKSDLCLVQLSVWEPSYTSACLLPCWISGNLPVTECQALN